MQKNSRWIAVAALAGLTVPFLVTGLSTLTAIAPFYFAVALFVLVAGWLIWKITSNSAEDED